MNIEIKSITGVVIYQYDCPNNTLKFTVEQAIREGYILDYADLRCADLDFGYFSGGRFAGADFSGCTARGADFKNCEAERAIFSHSHLSHADFRYGKLSNTNFSRSDLSYAEMADTDLQNAELDRCSLHDTNFLRSNLSGASYGTDEMLMAITADTVEVIETV